MGELRESQFVSQEGQEGMEKPEVIENEEDKKFIDAYFKRREEERGMIEKSEENAEKKGKGGLHKKIAVFMGGLTMLGMVNAASAQAGLSVGDILTKIAGGALDPGRVFDTVEGAITRPPHAKIKRSSESSTERREMNERVMVEIQRGRREIQEAMEAVLLDAGYNVIDREAGRGVGADLILKVFADETRVTRDTIDAWSLLEWFGVKNATHARWREVVVKLNVKVMDVMSKMAKKIVQVEGTARSLEQLNVDGKNVSVERRTDEDLVREATEEATASLLEELKKSNAPKTGVTSPPPPQPSQVPLPPVPIIRKPEGQGGETSSFTQSEEKMKEKVKEDFTTSREPDGKAFELFSPEIRDLYANEWNGMEIESDHTTGYYFKHYGQKPNDGWSIMRKKQPTATPEQSTPQSEPETRQDISALQEKIEKLKNKVQQDYLKGKPISPQDFKSLTKEERTIYVDEWNKREDKYHTTKHRFYINPKGGWLYKKIPEKK